MKWGKDVDATPHLEDALAAWLCVALGLIAYVVLRYVGVFVAHDVRTFWPGS